jgi:hypothetical protein
VEGLGGLGGLDELGGCVAIDGVVAVVIIISDRHNTRWLGGGGRRCTDLVGEKAVGGYPRLGARRDGTAEVVVNEGLSDAWIHGAPTNQWHHQQKGSGFAFSPHHRATGSRSWSGGGGV